MKTREEFAILFRQALLDAQALHSASDFMPKNPIIELHHVNAGDFTVDEAISAIWLDDNRFHRCIDVSVHRRRADAFFVVVAGFEPGDWSATYHPNTSGPFHILAPA